MSGLRTLSGFWSRTFQHMKKQTNMAVKAGGLYVPTKPYPMVQFSTPESITTCKTMSDRGIGGFSTASLELQSGKTAPLDLAKDAELLYSETTEVALVNEEPPHALFSGTISTELPRNNPQIMRTGFSGWRTKDLGYSLFGKGLFDLGQYAGVVMRVKSDGRKYFVNVQTDSVVPTDLHQHILPAKTPGQWETIVIPFWAFVRTNQGVPISPQNEMNTAKIKSIGISLTDRINGPYKLGIAEIYASNSLGKTARRDSGFAIEEEESMSYMSTPKQKRKPEEPEQIMM